MVNFSNAKVLDLAVHIVGNKSKDEEIILTETSFAIVDDVTEQYIKEYFFIVSPVTQNTKKFTLSKKKSLLSENQEAEIM